MRISELLDYIKKQEEAQIKYYEQRGQEIEEEKKPVKKSPSKKEKGDN